MPAGKPYEWRPVPGFEGYEVRRDGQVRTWLQPGPGMRRAKRPRDKKPVRGRDGRLHVQLRSAQGWETRAVEELVAAAWAQEERRSA